PLGFSVEIKRRSGDQVAARRCIRQVKHVFRSQKALVGESGLGFAEDLRTSGEVGSKAPCEVWAGLRASASGGKYRAVAHVNQRGISSAESVVNLRQSPKIVVAQQIRVIFEVGSNPHLVVESFGVVVP